MQLEFELNDEVSQALAEIGRTEDIQFSPDNSRLAVAGFKGDRLLILGLSIGGHDIKLATALTLKSAGLNYPHGLSWIDHETIIVANRGGEAVILRLPQQTSGEAVVDPIQTIRADHIDLLSAPGSVAVNRIGHGLLDVLICNNKADHVTRHLLREDDHYSVLSSEIVCRSGLGIPDGVAYDHARTWIAVSNHNDHSAFLYRVADLGKVDRPAGVLRGMAYPHGLRFTKDGRFLLVADAGAQFVYVFSSSDGDWSGERQPAASLRAVDEQTFLRGRPNDQEGGPKGIDISEDGEILVASCHEQPLAFFDIRKILEDAAADRPMSAPVNPGPSDPLQVAVERLALTRLQLGSLRSELESARAREAEFTQSWFRRFRKGPVRRWKHAVRGFARKLSPQRG